jgi:MFS transporter, PPP family, 3-phenylpropionic acid transporter
LLAAGSEAPFMKIADSFIRRYGMIVILLFAAFISACRWLFYFFEPSLTLVYATTIAQGFSVGLFIPAALQYVRDIAPESVRATAVSIYSAIGNGLGSWFCTFVGGYILDQWHVGHVYLFFSILTFAGMLILFIIMTLERKKAASV